MIGIQLEVTLPERYDLVSIQRVKWRGSDFPTWAVCVKVTRPEERSTLDYGIGEHEDLNEATRLAVIKAEARQCTPEGDGVKKQRPMPVRELPARREIQVPLSGLDLTL